jgi:DNA replication protein DnaC
MSKSYRPYYPEQDLLLPPSLREWLPEHHLVYFVSDVVDNLTLITTLGKALAEGKLDERLKLLTQPQLLICDEIGYLPIDRQGANLFFQLVSRRYERGSIIITSNQSLGAWGEVFGDTVIASAILDRLLHHSITINIKGESFRLKEKLKAGLLRPKFETPTTE